MNIYIHIPFCHQKCHYCYYYSFVPGNKRIVDDYLFYLEKEFDLRNKKKPFGELGEVKTVYIGGGTPNYLSTDQLERLFLILKKYLNLEKVKEFIVELNPAACDLKQLKIFQKYGVTRLSFGIQTLNENVLKKLNRHHAENPAKIIRLAKQLGFAINLDFMLGLPDQTVKDVNEAVRFVREIEPESSFWCELRSGTRQIKKFQNLPSHEKTVKMYEIVKIELSKFGYRQIIPEYFTNQEEMPLYLENWWTSQYSLGFGLSAFSKNKKTFLKNTDNFQEYVACLKDGKLPVRYLYKLSNEESARVFLISELKKGFADFNVIRDEFSIDLGKELKKELDELVSSGMIIFRNNKLRFSDKGFAISTPVVNLLLRKSQYLLRIMDTAFNFVDNMPNLEQLFSKHFLIVDNGSEQGEEIIFMSTDKKGVGILKRYAKK